MIYTIGNKKSYDLSLAEGSAVKTGRREPGEEFPEGYPGGVVFKSRELAQAFIDNGCMSRLLPRVKGAWEVYGLLASWDEGTYLTASGERALLLDTPFVALSRS